jgi:hypothetical protein
MRARIPAVACLIALLYCNWRLYQAKHSYFPPGAHYKVEVTVTGPDGEIIPAVARRPTPRPD